MKWTLAVQTLIMCVCAHGLWMEMMLNDLQKLRRPHVAVWHVTKTKHHFGPWELVMDSCWTLNHSGSFILFLTYSVKHEMLYSKFFSNLPQELQAHHDLVPTWKNTSLQVPICGHRTISLIRLTLKHDNGSLKKNMQWILGHSGLERTISRQKDNALEEPLNGPPRPIIWELTDSPGISLQSLRWVLFPTHGVLPWAPHTRLLICKPESSQADHSDQAIQPPKHRKNRAINREPRQSQDHIRLRRPGSQRAHPSCHHPRPLTSQGSQTIRTHQKKCLRCKQGWESRAMESLFSALWRCLSPEPSFSAVSPQQATEQ